MSEAYVAAMVLRLVDEGKLSLDDTVGDRRNAPAAADVTIRELLGHTSGLPDYLGDEELDDADLSEAEFLAAIEPPEDRGEFAYSNTNYLLLGAIARQAGGAPLVEQFGAMLGPLGLRDIGRFFDSLLVGRRVLEPQTLREMQTPGPDESYGLGIYADEVDGRVVWGHDRTYDGWETIAATDQESGTTIVVLARDGSKEGPGEILVALAAQLDDGSG